MEAQYAGVVLGACRQPYCEPHPSLRATMFGKFLVGVRVGPLDIVTEESLSAELVQALPAAPKHARIVMRFLDHAFHVTGSTLSSGWSAPCRRQ